MSLDVLNNRHFLMGLVTLILFTGLVAGSYPAFILSTFQPVATLRGRPNKGSHHSFFRNGLVVLQFSISVILIAGTLIVLTQLNYMKNQNLGFDKERVLVVRVRGRTIRDRYEAFRNELLQNSNIRGAVYSDGIPGRINTVLMVNQEGKDESETHTVQVIFSDFGLLSNYGIQIAHGRDFSKEFSTDTSGVFLINETAANKLGWGESAVGKKIGFSIQNMGPIVGIVEDFHYRSLKEAIGPLVICLQPGAGSFLSMKIHAENISETIHFVKEKWQAFGAERTFDYFFADQNFDSLYHSEERMSRIISSFAFITIFIACLGLFGLASFTAEQRTKEIGIRKVLGASALKIVLFLSKEFTKWVLIANVFALPISYFIMKNVWLPNFHYRISLGISPFALSGMISICIAVFTVSYQAIRAALANPVEALKYE